MQTKKQSLIESLTNITVGYLISLLSLFLIFPLLGIESSTGKNLLITLYFTVLSLLRSYIIRRYFNKSPTKALCRCGLSQGGAFSCSRTDCDMTILKE